MERRELGQPTPGRGCTFALYLQAATTIWGTFLIRLFEAEKPTLNVAAPFGGSPYKRTWQMRALAFGLLAFTLTREVICLVAMASFIIRTNVFAFQINWKLTAMTEISGPSLLHWNLEAIYTASWTKQLPDSQPLQCDTAIVGLLYLLNLSIKYIYIYLCIDIFNFDHFYSRTES